MRAWLLSTALLPLIGLPPAATAQDEGFDFQSPEVLFNKAYKAEFSHDPNKPDLERAIVYYGKALERAKKLLEVENAREEGDRSKIKIEYCIEWAVKSLASRARCREKKTPPEPGDALTDYGEIVSNWKDKAPEKVKELVDLAELKQTKNGVDIWLSAFAKQVDEWRRSGTMTSKGLEELKNKVWADMGGESDSNMKGLILTLNHEEEQVRSVIADKLQLVCNEEGIVMLIERLTDRGYRQGAALALRAIMERYSRVKEMEDSANKAEFRLKYVPRAGDAPNNKIQEITDIEVNNVRKKAAEERRKLPESIETPRIFEALSKVIVDESLDDGPRTEAIKVLSGFDRLQTEAVDVLLQVLQDVNSRVREAAAQACAKVNTQKSDDKHRLADMLMKLVTYEPVNDTELEAERMAVEQETHAELQPLLSKLAALMLAGKKDEQEIARRELEVKKLELIRGVQRKQANSEKKKKKRPSAWA